MKKNERNGGMKKIVVVIITRRDIYIFGTEVMLDKCIEWRGIVGELG